MSAETGSRCLEDLREQAYFDALSDIRQLDDLEDTCPGYELEWCVELDRHIIRPANPESGEPDPDLFNDLGNHYGPLFQVAEIRAGQAGWDLTDPQVTTVISESVEDALDHSVTALHVAANGGGGGEEVAIFNAVADAAERDRQRRQMQTEMNPAGSPAAWVRPRSHRGAHRRQSRPAGTRTRGSRRGSARSTGPPGDDDPGGDPDEPPGLVSPGGAPSRSSADSRLTENRRAVAGVVA